MMQFTDSEEQDVQHYSVHQMPHSMFIVRLLNLPRCACFSPNLHARKATNRPAICAHHHLGTQTNSGVPANDSESMK